MSEGKKIILVLLALGLALYVTQGPTKDGRDEDVTAAIVRARNAEYANMHETWDRLVVIDRTLDRKLYSRVFSMNLKGTRCPFIEADIVAARDMRDPKCLTVEEK